VSTKTVAAADGGTIEVPVVDIDLYQPEILPDPWEILKGIRELGPMVWNERGFWMTARDRVCRHILAHPAEMRESGMSTAFFGPEAFISIDAKQRHNELRNIWVSAFSMEAVARLAVFTRGTSNKMIDAFEDELRDGKAVDVMGRLCRVIPTYVIAHMMGVSDDMIPHVVRWSDLMGDATLNGFPIDYDNDPHWLAAEQAKKDFSVYLREQFEYRRRKPGKDLISSIVNAQHDVHLSEEGMLQNTRQLLFAGNETTAKWLGHIFETFAKFPDVLREVVEDRALLRPAAEEIMRWQGVTQLNPRTSVGETAVIEGIRIEPDVDVLMLIGAAGRDPARYPDPDKLDIHREQKPHLGFGFGMHTCLGAVLARMEVHETVTAFLDRFPDFELARPVVYGNFSLRGATELWVRLPQ
jgi:cytochrome P450